MASNAAIRAALKTALDNAYGSTWNTSAYMLGADANPPQMDVSTAGIQYDTAMARGNDEIKFIVRALAQHGNDVQAQITLDGLQDVTGSTSMKAALEADRSLGGVVSDCHVISASELKIYNVSTGGDTIGIEFLVEVYP